MPERDLHALHEAREPRPGTSATAAGHQTGKSSNLETRVTKTMAWNEPGNGKDPWKRDDSEPNDLDQIVQQLAASDSAVLLAVAAEAANPPVAGRLRVDCPGACSRGRRPASTVLTKPSAASCSASVPIRRRRCRDCAGTCRFRSNASTSSTRSRSNNYPFRTEMLTADEQYVFIQMVVQYRRSDPVNFSFNVVDPELTAART